MSSNHASLDAAATDRKARLAKLAALKRKQPEPETSGEAAEQVKEPQNNNLNDVTKKYLSGRNYDAETRGAKLGFDQTPTEGQITLELQAKEIAREVAEQAKKDEDADQPIDLFKLQPKKPNWDLKRDLDEKMKILNRIEEAQRTAKAKGAGANEDKQGEEVGIEGEMLVEGIHVRERQEADEDDDLA
ncbi:hypothetical protein AN1350.2 [Aspergillus nidulans FGSC A4]|uniref:Uncharacterized protein n=1 Tax=Emericella nidulans (strain FGSC A4 / ATCC 38163 / CBS 112.46 / NRRL 194 / M139) TaxID=227321 RepID=Q5BDN0_EMENI|nr:hypothetical protein [Aspergillus nidulans FGSC A4]EAA65533.1 hypothetical protein AN1350.2 [Aspergillus nidulans FGSC A4]CBF87667.1 TPA: conserved hypothetical protein [Aspergillus nidulans FGSC A4]|eukprot:XP_658954.1 hypothetical protein AN1350.2 [Aspergillus nidulans FGSC A4]